MRRARAAVVAVVLVSLLTATALALAASGPSPVSPPNGKSYKRGFAMTFRARSSVTTDPIWFHVSKSKRKDANGVIGHEVSLGQGRREGSSTVFRYKVRKFNFPAFWLNRPGRYYWQPHRIACENETNTSDCQVEGAIRSFRIRR